jgi:uroporphyrinogen decarboxylase
MPTRREHVLNALNHVRPEKVPVDFGGHRSSGIMAIAYRRLREHLHLAPRPIRVYDVVQQLAIIDDDVLDRFDADTIELGRGFCRDDRWWKPWRLPDGTECLIPSWFDVRKQGDDWLLYGPSGKAIAVQKAGCLYFEQIHWPYLDGIPDDLSGLEGVMPDVMWAVPTPPGPAAPDAQALAAGAEALRRRSDRAVIGLFGGNLLEWSQFLCRIDNLLLYLAAEPESVHRLLDRLVELHLKALEAYLAAVGRHIDVILFGDDLGMQTGPQISPAMYREFFKPRHRAMWTRAKQLADVKVMLHSCGGIRPLMADLIEAGIDAANPVQTSCAGMDPAELKAEFGERHCFWGGGCDTQSVLPYASPQEVRRHVRRRLEILSPGGGFVFQQVHNILSDVPPANVVAMFDTVAAFNQGADNREP